MTDQKIVLMDGPPEAVDVEKVMFAVAGGLVVEGQLPLASLERAGWMKLPAGVLRKVRASGAFIGNGSGGGRYKPYLVIEGDRERLYAEVRVLGPSSLVADERSGACGGKAGAVWLETWEPLLVKE